MTALYAAPPCLWAAVDLQLRPVVSPVEAGTTIEIGLYAVSDDDTDQDYSVVDVILQWDARSLELIGAVDNGSLGSRFISGFPPDDLLGGLNVTHRDGDALYQTALFVLSSATPSGVLITTFRFIARAAADSTVISIVDTLGGFSSSRVIRPVAELVTGQLGTATVSVTADVRLSVMDLVVPAGRVADILVSGSIQDQEAFGIQVILELEPRPDVVGALSFTLAPPVDITQLEDPWSFLGIFTPFDTDLAGENPNLNGSLLDNGSTFKEFTTFEGEVASYPIISDMGTRGTWDVRMCVDACNTIGDKSHWVSLDGLITSLRFGVVRVVALGDGDGDGSVVVKDFSDLQICYTGDVGPLAVPAYPLTGEPPCRVYDFDGDGDIGTDDLAAFTAEMSNPAP